MRLKLIWAFAALAALSPSAARGEPSQHKLSVTFNYDFTDAKGCKNKQTGRCVKRFIIYDVTDPNNPVRLFSIGVPANVKKIIYQIKGSSPTLTLDDGIRTFAATAQWADGTESDKNACKVTVTVGAQPHVSVNISNAIQQQPAREKFLLTSSG